jgi:xylose isomerase
VRQQSIDPAYLFHGHIGGVDIFARSLLNAAAMIEGGKVDAALAASIDPHPRSGRQEYVENVVSRYI